MNIFEKDYNMKKIKTILIIVVAILLVMMGYLFVRPLQSETSQSINKQECQERIELQPNDTVSQTFQCEVDDLNKITFQSPYKVEGIQYHVVVKSGDEIWTEQDIVCQNANGTAKVSFSEKKSKDKKITVEITNKSQESVSLPKENKTEHTLSMKYYGLADNYFFAWYPLFAASILIMLVAVI